MEKGLCPQSLTSRRSSGSLLRLVSPSITSGRFAMRRRTQCNFWMSLDRNSQFDCLRQPNKAERWTKNLCWKV